MKKGIRRLQKRPEKQEDKEVCKRPPICPLVVLHGRREIELYDCKKILSYGCDEVVLLCGKETLSLQGRGLVCSSFSAGTVTVKGELSSLAFIKHGKGETL